MPVFGPRQHEPDAHQAPWNNTSPKPNQVPQGNTLPRQYAPQAICSPGGLRWSPGNMLPGGGVRWSPGQYAVFPYRTSMSLDLLF